MVVSGLFWVILVPFLVMLWLEMWWLALIGVAGAVWWTQDYIRKGGIDPDYVSRAGGWSGKPPSRT
jgi:hypothetical protein